MITSIVWDKDPSQEVKIKNIAQSDEINSLDDILQYCIRKMNLPSDFAASKYGLKTKTQQVLLAAIGDIVKAKKKNELMEAFQTDGKEYYDDHLDTSTLILRNLEEEAGDSVKELQKITKLMQEANRNRKSMDKKERQKQVELVHSQLKRISYNLRAELDVFVESFVANNGIKQIMYLIEECQEMKEFELVYIAGQMLSVIFMYGCGIDSIQKHSKRFFEKFFELSMINQQIKK